MPNQITQLKDRVHKGLKIAEKVAKAEDRLNRKITKAIIPKRKDKSHIEISNVPKKKHKPFKQFNTSGAQIRNSGRSKVDAPIIVRKREFITNINGSSSFNVVMAQPVSLLNPTLFPWGSQILPQYEMYRLKSLTISYRTITGVNTTTGALGSYIMGFVYDVNDPQLNDRSTMLNYQGFKQQVLNKDLSIHLSKQNNPLPIRYVSHNSTAPEFNDYAVFYLATDNCTSTSGIGELYVDYEIELFIPRISSSMPFQLWQGTMPNGTGANIVTAIPANLNGSSLTQSTVGNGNATLTSGGGINFLAPGYYRVEYNFYSLSGSYTMNSDIATNYSNVSGSDFYFTPWWDLGSNTGEPNSSFSFGSSTTNTNGGFFYHYGEYVDASKFFAVGTTSMTPNLGLTTSSPIQFSVRVMKVPNPTVAPTTRVNLELSSRIEKLEMLLKAKDSKDEVNNDSSKNDPPNSPVNNNNNNNNNSSPKYIVLNQADLENCETNETTPGQYEHAVKQHRISNLLNSKTTVNTASRSGSNK